MFVFHSQYNINFPVLIIGGCPSLSIVVEDWMYGTITWCIHFIMHLLC